MQEIFLRNLSRMLYLTYNAELWLSPIPGGLIHESIRTLIILCKSIHSKQWRNRYFPIHTVSVWPCQTAGSGIKELGVKDADVDEHCYVYGHIPATRGYESRQKLGFIAHMDTVSDFCDHPVTPVITPNYDGKDLALGTSGRVLSPKMFLISPH